MNVRAIILSSIYESGIDDPRFNHDIGYEVTDHTAIAAEYGSMDDFDLLVEIGRAHVRTPVTTENLVCRLLLE